MDQPRDSESETIWGILDRVIAESVCVRVCKTNNSILLLKQCQQGEVMSTMNINKVDPLNEERSVIDSLIASSQNLMGSTENQATQQCPSPSEYEMTSGKSQLMLKSRRGRTSFTPSQLSDLEHAFANTHYPDFQTRKDLSKKLKIPDDRIQVWFQNRRAKWRKTQRQLNGGVRMSPYHGNQAPGTVPQNQVLPPVTEIALGFAMSRPSSIRHTASLIKGETNYNGEGCPVSQAGNTDSKNTYQAVEQPPPPPQSSGNLLNVYEKSTIPTFPDNQRTAPSLYSLSATISSSGQYIVLGANGNPPTTYPVAISRNNYSVPVPSQPQKY